MSFRSDDAPSPADGQRRRTITDVRALTAFAHPLRQRILHHLVRSGPDTATNCAEAVGSTASNCSYHLRLLARHGLVERVECSDARDRPWRAVASGFDFQPRPGDAESFAAHAALQSVELGELMRMFGTFLDGYADIEPQWQRASAFNSYALSCTPEELAHLNEVIDLLVRPYIIADRTEAPATAREVSLSVQTILRPPEAPS